MVGIQDVLTAITICLIPGALIVDYWINHHYQAYWDWPQRKFLKTMLWWTVGISLMIIVILQGSSAPRIEGPIPA
jgi:hypothetical protein